VSRKTYPLETLRELRRDQADEEQRRLGERVRRTERARAAHVATQAAVRAEQERGARVLAEERSLLDCGQLCAADLALADQYRRASETRVEQLAERERRAAAGLEDALRNEADARRELARKEGAAKAMDRHREDWQDANARDRERAEEEAILDQWTLKRHAGRGA
jgi:hypothetical protein